MLSALHGIGVIFLNPENPSENEDFRDYIELVSTYYQTGRLRSKDWSKV